MQDQKVKAIYTATSQAHEDEKDQSPHYWVSYDPENEGWLEMKNALPEVPPDELPALYDEIVQHFGPRETVRNGKKEYFSPIRMATRGIKMYCKEPVFHEPIIVTETKG
jgi:hypothetical protein